MTQFPTNCYNCNAPLIIESFSSYVSGRCNCDKQTVYNKHYIYIILNNFEVVYFLNSISDNHDLWFYNYPTKDYKEPPVFKTTTTKKHNEISNNYLNSIVKTFIL